MLEGWQFQQNAGLLLVNLEKLDKISVNEDVYMSQFSSVQGLLLNMM